jgi:hypothetical protein
MATYTHGLHSASGTKIASLIRKMHLLDTQRKEILAELAICGRSDVLRDMGYEENADLVAMWSETSETMKAQVSSAVAWADELQGHCKSLQTRLGAAESRIRELEDQLEAQGHHAWEERFRTAEHRANVLQNEFVTQMNSIENLAEGLQSIAAVLDVSVRRAQMRQGEIVSLESQVRRRQEEIFKLKDQLRAQERESATKLIQLKHDEWFGWNEVGPENLIDSMRKTMHAPAIFKQQCAGLTFLATRSEKMRGFLGERGAVEVLIAALRGQENSRDLQVLVFAAVAALVKGSSENSRRVSICGGIEVLLGGMRRHLTHLGLSEQGCWTLQELALNSEDNRRRILESGGVGQIVAAMRAHKANIIMQQTGCAVLSELLNRDGKNSRVLEVDIALIKEQEYIHAVLACMRTYHNYPALQELGCKALSSLASWSDSWRLRIGDLGGIDAAISAMRMHSTAGVQEQGCNMLQNLVNDSDLTNSIRIGDGGGLDVVGNAMRAYPMHRQIQDYACCALRRVCHNNNENKKRIVPSGCFDALMSAMQRHRDSVDLQEQACWVIIYVAATSVEISESLSSRGAIENIAASMRACGRHEGVQAQGCWALANLATNSETNSRRILENRGVNEIITAMRLHQTDLSVQASVRTHVWKGL